MSGSKLCISSLEPGNKRNQTKVVRNILHCFDYGTQMDWLIDPEEELVFVYFADRTLILTSQRHSCSPFC